LSGFWALLNPKVEVFLLAHIQLQLEDQRAKNTILSKSCREFNSRHFEPFPGEKYSILTILDHFK
jgi:hypothetical protein